MKRVSPRKLTMVAAVAAGTLTLGSCSGVMLARYTMSGMNPFYYSPAATFAVERYATASDVAQAEPDWLGTSEFAPRDLSHEHGLEYSSY